MNSEIILLVPGMSIYLKSNCIVFTSDKLLKAAEYITGPKYNICLDKEDILDNDNFITISKDIYMLKNNLYLGTFECMIEVSKIDNKIRSVNRTSVISDTNKGLSPVVNLLDPESSKTYMEIRSQNKILIMPIELLTINVNEGESISI